MIHCIACKGQLPSGGNFVQCAGCNGGLHFECSGLSRSTWKAKGATKKLEWRCKFCRQSSKACGSTVTSQVASVHNQRNSPDDIASGSGLVQSSMLSPDLAVGAIVDNVPLPPTCAPELFHNTLAATRRRVSVIARIPKGARILAAEQLTSTITTVVNNNDEASWQQLLRFSFVVLRRSCGEKKVSLTTQVKNNLTTFAGGIDPAIPLPANSSATLPSMTTSRRAQTKLGDGDVRGAVRLLCSEDDIAPFTPETLEKLREKHPPEKLDPCFPDPPRHPQPQRTTPKEIVEAVKSFAPGSAGGLDGLRPQHLKDLLSTTNGEAAEKLAEALAGLVDLMLDGRVPVVVSPYLYGATLTALKKKDGGIRPIAVGNAFRRLAAKIACRRSLTEVGSKLRPHQLGFGTPGGVEAAVHAARRFVEDPGPPRALLKLDYKNAFNSMHRDHMLRSTEEEAPDVYPMAWQCYRNKTILSFGDSSLESADGCQQGDPLGPLLFCVGLQPLCREIRSPLNVWYLDDGTLGAPVPTLLEDVRSAQAFSERSGLVLNPSKCEVFFIDHSPEEEAAALESLGELLPGIRQVQSADLCLLGSPLTEEATPITLREKKTAAVRMGERLQDWCAHNALYIMKNCLAIPKLIHIVRTCPTWLFVEDLGAIDEVFRTIVQKICNTSMEEATWRQATLPVCKGGLGIRRIEELAIPAFLASSYSTGPLVAQLLSRTTMDNAVEDVWHSQRVAVAEDIWL